MSDQTAPRALNVISEDLAKATAELEKASTADAKKKVQERLDGLNAEHAAARNARYDAVYAELQSRYTAATGAGEKAALRRHMNNIREAQGKTKLIAGSRRTSAATAVPQDVLAMLRDDGVI